MLSFHNVSFAYGDVPVLTDLSFDCPPGAVIWLSGANGTGKSTAIHLALGLLTPDSGTVRNQGILSAVFQENRLCDHLTAVANVRLGLTREAPNAEILEELAQAGVAPDDAARPVSQLSGGQRRRVSLVRALMRPSDILCLDEPYTGIDEPSLDDIFAYTRSRIRSRSVLLVAHDPDVALAFTPIQVTVP